MSAPLTIDGLRRDLAKRFTAAKIDSPLLDARLLVGGGLGLDHTALAAQAERPLMGEEIAAIHGLAMRRLAGEPVARILGAREFWGLSLRLSPATLVPRPDTETLVEAALLLSDFDAPLRIADLGTGSGAILLALLHERPNAFGVGTDISMDALRTARGNAYRLGLAKRAAFVLCDYAAALQAPFDLIVSNPPYIASADIAGLAREVREHDPLRALDGGPDGLAAYRTIVQHTGPVLARGGYLALEVGWGQSEAVGSLLRAAGFEPLGQPRPDLAGNPRAVVAQKPFARPI